MRDGTTIGIAYTNIEGKCVSEIHEVPYSKFERYEDLPYPCKSDETKKEFERFKRKETENKLSDKLINKINWYNRRI